MSYVLMDVGKPGLNKGAGGDKKDNIILLACEDILTFPSRDSKGVVITGNIVMKPDAYMVNIYATKTSIKVGSKTEGEIDAEGFIHTISFEHPGNELAIREFKQNNVSRDFVILVEHCSNAKKDMLGTLCAPMRMKINWEDDKDKNKSTFTFESALKSPYDVADYQGDLTWDTVKGTAAANATAVNVAAGEGQYQLTDGTSAAAEITTLSNPVEGGIYTLLGSGGSHPSTVPTGNDFILDEGATWTALSGAKLTVKAYKSGASTWSFIEQSRA